MPAAWTNAGTHETEFVISRVSGSTSGSGHGGVAAAPAGHRVGLRQAVEQDGPVEHPGHARDRGDLAVVGDPPVDLIAEHPGGAREDHLGGRPEVVSRDHPAGRIVRRVQDHELGARAEPVAQIVQREAEVELLAQRQRHRHAAGPPDRGLVDRESRVRIDDLVARLAHREDRQEQEQLGAVADEHPLGRHLDLPAPRQLGGDHLAKLGHAGARRVARSRRARLRRCRRRRRARACGSRAARSRGARSIGRAARALVPEPGPRTRTRSRAVPRPRQPRRDTQRGVIRHDRELEQTALAGDLA